MDAAVALNMVKAKVEVFAEEQAEVVREFAELAGAVVSVQNARIPPEGLSFSKAKALWEAVSILVQHGYPYTPHVKWALGLVLRGPMTPAEAFGLRGLLIAFEQEDLFAQLSAEIQAERAAAAVSYQ